MLSLAVVTFQDRPDAAWMRVRGMPRRAIADGVVEPLVVLAGVGAPLSVARAREHERAPALAHSLMMPAMLVLCCSLLDLKPA